MPSQVDMAAFTVGKNLALSPGAVVFKNEVLELIQYAPATEQVYRRPLLLLPPQINKFYMLDLAPGRSIIEYLVKQGFTVFAISWRNPTPAQRAWGLETYLRAALQAIDAARDIAASETINMLGACAGGMTLTALLAHLAARGERCVNAVTLLVTVLDTSVETQLGLFTMPETIAAAKAVSRAKGVLAGRDMARVFNWMRPNDLIWNYWVNNYLFGEERPPSTSCTGTMIRPISWPSCTPICSISPPRTRFATPARSRCSARRSAPGRSPTIPLSWPV
jgi:polyhydroxyalkanoate synthase subunit PhaC